MDDKQNAITELNIKKLKDKQGDSYVESPTKVPASSA